MLCPCFFFFPLFAPNHSFDIFCHLFSGGSEDPPNFWRGSGGRRDGFFYNRFSGTCVSLHGFPNSPAPLHFFFLSLFCQRCYVPGMEQGAGISELGLRKPVLKNLAHQGRK